MKIGIIIFSRTGNTLHVAQVVRDACLAQGHTVVIERISAENEDPNSKHPIRLKNAPDPACFDAVIFGAPVQGFSLSPIMKAYLVQLPQLAGKKVGCFVTQHFPKPWMGGKQAAKQMRSLCKLKGVDVAQIGIINWTNKLRNSQIDDVASTLGRIGG